MRFGVGEFAGLVVESNRPEFWTTFQAGTSQAVSIAPFQEVGADQVRQNFATIKAQVRAIVSPASLLNQEPESPTQLTQPTASATSPILLTEDEGPLQGY